MVAARSSSSATTAATSTRRCADRVASTARCSGRCTARLTRALVSGNQTGGLALLAGRAAGTRVRRQGDERPQLCPGISSLEVDGVLDYRREVAGPVAGVGRAAAGRAALLVAAGVCDQDAEAGGGVEALEPRPAARAIGEPGGGGLAVWGARLGDGDRIGDADQGVRAGAGDPGYGHGIDGAGLVDAPALGSGDVTHAFRSE